jgi:hypothetical protein
MNRWAALAVVLSLSACAGDRAEKWQVKKDLTPSEQRLSDAAGAYFASSRHRSNALAIDKWQRAYREEVRNTLGQIRAIQTRCRVYHKLGLGC